MGRTTLEYDDRLLRRAQKALGTSGIKPTIERALEQCVHQYSHEMLLESLRKGERIGPTPDELQRLREPYVDSLDG